MFASKHANGVLVENSAGITEYLHYDQHDDKFAVERIQDIEPILDSVKNARAFNGGKNKAGDMYHAASVPTLVVDEWLAARNLTMKDFNEKLMNQFLDDPANSMFRIWQGRM